MSTMPQIEVSIGEVVTLCAGDPILFCKTFFPKTFRQEFALFHEDLWNLLEDRAHRHTAISVFRGGAKTTILRVFTAKRIAYGISNTILFVSEAQEHSKKSLDWLRMQVETNSLFSQAFGLSRGKKWTEDVIQIDSALFQKTITVIALGITGQTRGVNVADYRPDLIVVDDPCSEENTATPEQRQKIADLFFGALEKSLTPASECPEAKMVLLQTVLNGEDLISMCLRDSTWATREYSCFDEKGRSTWPARFPTETLLADKESHIARNQLPLWLREMEGKIVSSETAMFKAEWLKYWDVLPEGMTIIIGIDPVPPPSEREMATGLRKKDSEVLSVVGALAGRCYLLEYSENKGHTPEWTTNEFFRLVDKWRPLKARVEGIAYQRTLKWILEEEMKKRGRYIQMDAVIDRRKKSHRIAQAFSGIASQGQFFVHQSQVGFISQFTAYPNVSHDDILDATALAMPTVGEAGAIFAGLLVQQQDIPALPDAWRAAP